ncbi:SLC13 family permease [Janibacter limosus]|uniref:SLC13 family permease n=1 Tax=Janibacter limosus TaxID=53458 RepID=UPI000B0D1724|nr:SLC13 family permease [Janibacter limosus]
MIPPELVEVLARALPVMVFLVAITVVAEISDLAGVFDVAGHAAARVAGRRVLALWLLLAAVAVVVTVFLGLDTTAVLLTPVALTVARQVGATPAPFAVTTLFLANTASLFLPVSNLTNLLAAQRFSQLGVDHAESVALALAPGLAAVLATLVVVGVVHRRQLRGRFVAEAPDRPHDRVLLGVAAGTCLAIGPLFALGGQPWIVSCGAAVVLLAAVWWRARFLLRRIRPPWIMALVVGALLGLVQIGLSQGAAGPLADLLGHGEQAGDLLRVAGIGALGSNLVNNLPAYLALEDAAATSPTRLMALLVGTNVGPVVTPWGSLATLLWLHRMRTAGVCVHLVPLAAQGLAVALLAGSAAVLVLVLAA